MTHRRAVVAAALGAWGLATAAAEPRVPVVIDHARVEPSVLGGGRSAVQLIVRSIDATGKPIAVADASSWRLYVDGRAVRAAPVVAPSDQVAGETVVALVLAATPDFGPALPALVEALDEGVVGPLRREDRVAVIAYANSVVTSSRLNEPADARKALGHVEAEHDGEAPVLLEAVSRGLQALVRYRGQLAAAPQRVLVVVSDGQDWSADRDEVRQLGDLAARHEVRIHTMAYAPGGSRGPLLHLGELSKRSLGTVRWLRSGEPEAFRQQFSALGEELRSATALTWWLSVPRDRASLEVAIDAGGGVLYRSNKVSVTRSCGGQACGDGALCAEARCVAVAPAPPWWHAVGGMAWRYGPWVAGSALALALLVRLRRRRQAPHGPTMVWALRDGQGASVTLQLRPAEVLGRSGPHRARLNDPSIAETHAVVHRDAEGAWTVADTCGQGVFVNGVRVTRGKVYPGCVVRLGRLEWKVVSTS